MLFDTYSSQAAQASLDSLWMNTKAITNNLANESTPGYKAQRVSFEEVLSNATVAQGNKGSVGAGQSAQPSNDPQTNRYANTSGVNPTFRSRVITDSARSTRIDGNNVSLEKEQAELWKTYAQYSYLLDRVSGHYSSVNTAISNMRT